MRKVEKRFFGTVQSRLTLIGLAVIWLAASLPLMVNYCIDGADVSFYLRLLEEGGGENILYLLPGLLIRLGADTEKVYKGMLFLINLATAVSAWLSFEGIFEDRTTALLGSMLYTWLPYRLDNLYCRGDLGESLAMTFLPILFLGLYRIYTIDENEPGYRRLWMLPAVVYSLLLASYWLSFVTAACFTLLVCAAFWKKTWRRQTLFVLLKTVLAFTALNAWALGLALYRIRSLQFPLAIPGSWKIQSRGVYLSEFLMLYFKSGSSRDVSGSGNGGLQPYGAGFAVTFGVLVYLWLLFVGRYRDKREDKASGFVKKGTILGFLLAFMTMNSFPWDTIQCKSGLLNWLIGLLYEPVRLMPLAAVCLVMTACEAARQIKQRETKNTGRIFLAAVAVIALVGTQYLTGDILRTGEPRSLYGTVYGEGVTDADYQLENLDISLLDYARYESSRQPMPAAFGALEGVSIVCGGVIIVLIWRKRRVEKV